MKKKKKKMKKKKKKKKPLAVSHALPNEFVRKYRFDAYYKY